MNVGAHVYGAAGKRDRLTAVRCVPCLVRGRTMPGAQLIKCIKDTYAKLDS
jgi:hypothetical protein